MASVDGSPAGANLAPTLGDAIGTAKQQLLANGDDYYEQITNTFMLFGDPAMALKVPLPRRPAQLEAEGQLNAIALNWQAAADCNDQPLAGYNLYRATAPGGPYEKLNEAVLYPDGKGLYDLGFRNADLGFV